MIMVSFFNNAWIKVISGSSLGVPWLFFEKSFCNLPCRKNSAAKLKWLIGLILLVSFIWPMTESIWSKFFFISVAFDNPSIFCIAHNHELLVAHCYWLLLCLFKQFCHGLWTTYTVSSPFKQYYMWFKMLV